MAIAFAVSVVVIVVVFVHLAAGWVYANGFRRDALRPQRPARARGVWVRSIGRGTITVTAQAPRQDIGHPGVLGLHWDGGYGRLEDVISVDALDVTRGFEFVTGEMPPVCPAGPSTDCPPVDIESYAFPSDPGDLALDYEDVHYESGLGPMPAWAIEAPGARRWAVHIHGWTAERREALRLLPVFRSAGLTSLVIDYRNDPSSPVDPSGHYRFGLTEWEDVEGAVRHALDAGADEVILVGYSTGAAHVMSFLERSVLRDSIVGVVMDSPNVNLLEVVRHGSRGLRFEPTPIRITRLMAEFGLWIADLRWKIDWEATNYLQRADTILDVPTLVFHGTADHRIPISISRQLEARARDVVTLVETPAAGHVMSWNADPRRYERYLSSYLKSL